MYKIIHTAGCIDIAARLADRLYGSVAIPIESVLADPESLGDFDCLGIVFERVERGVPSSIVKFIEDVLGNYDLSNLVHMFSICVCEGKPAHALKIVEKLCSKVGCAPSLSVVLPPDGYTEESLEAVIEKIRSGEIALAEGSVGTMFYMKAHGISMKRVRR